MAPLAFGVGALNNQIMIPIKAWLALILVILPNSREWQGNRPATNYPVSFETTPARLQAAEAAWSSFLSEHRLAFVSPDLDPVLCTPRKLPPSLANKISVRPPGDTGDAVLSDLQAREFLKQFIDRNHVVLGGDQRRGTLSTKDLSLQSFSANGPIIKAIYRQMNFPYLLAEPFGRLELSISRTGRLLQMSSTIVPFEDFTAKARLEPGELRDRFMGRQFKYRDIAGAEKTYTVGSLSEVSPSSLVILPVIKVNTLTLRLAYPVEVGKGMTWTVFIDAVTGDEAGVKQNFVS